MFHLQKCLRFEIPKAFLCHEHELNYEFLHDLHHGQANNEETYILKMSLSVLDGGLWGDFTDLLDITLFATFNLCLE
jgi:hypothetical protein